MHIFFSSSVSTCDPQIEARPPRFQMALAIRVSTLSPMFLYSQTIEAFAKLAIASFAKAVYPNRRICFSFTGNIFFTSQKRHESFSKLATAIEVRDPRLNLLNEAFAKASNTCHNGQNWSRTSDTRIFSPLLYHLSYLAIDCNVRGFCKSLKRVSISPAFLST